MALEEPKNDYGRRSIKLSEALIRMLRERQAAEAGPEDLVLNLLPDPLSHGFMDVVKSAALEASLHDIRHTHASLLIRAGVPMNVVQERLGHASILTTMDLYIHIMPGMHQPQLRSSGKNACTSTDTEVSS